MTFDERAAIRSQLLSGPRSSSSSLLLSSLELSDTQVYEPQLRALLGTAAHFCEVVGLGEGVGTRREVAVLRGVSRPALRLHRVVLEERVLY